MSVHPEDMEVEVDDLPCCPWCGSKAKAVMRDAIYVVGCSESNAFINTFYAYNFCVEYVWAYTLDVAIAKWKERCRKELR